MAALPDEDFAAISAYLSSVGDANLAAIRANQSAQREATNASRAAAGLPSIEQQEAEIAEAFGLNPDTALTTQRDLFQIAETMHSIGADVWGFVVVKLWGYEDGEKERWTQFWNRWGELADAKLRDMGANGNLREGFAGRLQWFLVEDEKRLSGKGWKEARELFSEMAEEEDRIPNGLDLDLCLVIDEKVVSSLLDGDEKEAFVVGVDVNDAEEEEEGGEQSYSGHFKIGVDVLVPELWETLQRQAPSELDPGEGNIFKGIVG